MTETRVDSSFSKSKGLVFFEYVLLALCLCVIALRTTFTESPAVQATTFAGDISNNLYSVSISTILIFSFVLWVVWSFCSKRFVYRLSGIEIGLGIFCIAAVVSGFAAADKRLAITNFVTLLAPILMAVLLVQILDSQSKVKLALAVIVALGVVSAYRCWEQYEENEHLIEFYEQNPEAALAQVQKRIVPNSLEHFQFEHRLYSKDISGFFTTSNSAGSFALLASFAAIGLFIGKYKNRNSAELGFVWIITCGIAVAVVIFGLVITRSKGAIIALLFAAAMFVMYLCFGNWLRTHKKAILITCLLLGLAGASVVVWYGLAHARLPGGNSMLVRWQYWQASVKMYADHLFTGVGPGNFGHFYTHYKPASALESVADPHNFILSILTQYGPLGLVGFLAMIFLPLWTVSSPASVSCSSQSHWSEPDFKRLAIVVGIIVSAVLLFIRPIIFPLPPTASRQERYAGIIILYLMPVIVFVGGFVLAAAGERSAKKSHASIAAAALFCAVVGVLIHNLIDFAIFEPGVFTTFWAIIACLIAIDFRQKSRPQFVLKPAAFVRMLIVAGGLVLIGVYFNYALIPVAKTETNIKLAMPAVKYAYELLDKAAKGNRLAPAKIEWAIRDIEYAHPLLDKAAKDDRVDPTALRLNGSSYLLHYDLHYELTGRKQSVLLRKAEECFRNAVNRDEADFKNYEKLSVVYNLLAEPQKAFDSASLAVERYPVSARLRVKLAGIAEQLGKSDIAIAHYRKAVDIEDSFRRQFQLMYPGREVISRLGEEKYQFAKQRIKHLSERPTP